MSVKFLAQGNNGLPLTGFEPTRTAILESLAKRINISATPPLRPVSIKLAQMNIHENVMKQNHGGESRDI